MPTIKIKDRVISCTRCHTVVPSHGVIDSIIPFPLSSALVTHEGNIIPHQLWKHGFGSYPLDISGETAPASWALPIQLALLGRCILVSCWYCVVVEPWVETRERKRPTNGPITGSLIISIDRNGLETNEE